MKKWQPIEDLPANWDDLRSLELPPLASVWHDQERQLQGTVAYRDFMSQMRREIAIETGIVERLYTIDRGITQILIEHGIDEALIPHGKTDRPVAEVVAIIRDQEDAVESLFDFVAGRRALSNLEFDDFWHATAVRYQSRDRDPSISKSLLKGPSPYSSRQNHATLARSFIELRKAMTLEGRRG